MSLRKLRPGATAREKLVYHVQELERLEEAKRAAADELKDGFAAAAAAGFDRQVLRAVLKLRQLTPGERRERRALEAIYLAALGMLDGDPLPDEARRRLDEQDQGRPPSEAAAPPSPKDQYGARPEEQSSAPPPAPQRTLELEDPEEARQEGRDAAAAGKRIYDNPYPAGDPCRAAWDEGWCEARKSHGMETPAAYQRRRPPPSDPDPGNDGGKHDESDEKGGE